MTACAPAANAFVMSPEYRIPPSAIIGMFDPFKAFTAEEIADSCGTPTPETIRVVQMEPGPMQNEAMLSVLHQWAKSDLAAASDWAGNLPTGVLRDRAMNELAGLQNPVPE